MKMTRIEAIASHIAVGVYRQLRARRDDGISTTTDLQRATVLKRHFETACKQYKLNDSDKESVYSKLGWAFQHIEKITDKLMARSKKRRHK
jgi:hypothetical protein